MKNENIVRLLTIRESSNDAEAIASMMRNAGYAIRFTNIEDEEDLAENLRRIFDEMIELKSILIIEDLPLLLCQCVKVPSRIAVLLDEYTSSKGLLIVTTATH